MVHVCEIQGHDSEGFGTEKMPFKTPLKAVEFVKADAQLCAAIKVRKNMEEGYQPIPKAALKKAGRRQVVERWKFWDDIRVYGKSEQSDAHRESHPGS